MTLTVPVSGSFVVGGYASNNTIGTITLPGGHTAIYNSTNVGSAHAAASYANAQTAGSRTYSYTDTSPSSPVTCAAVFVPASAAPVITGTSPAAGALAVPPDGNLVATFSEAVVAGSGNIELWQSGGSSPVESFNVATSPQITIAGSTVTIDPSANLAPNTFYYVLIASTAVVDTSGGNSTVESFDVVSSPRLVFSGQTLTINPTNDLGPGVGYHVLIDSTAIVDTSGGNAFAGISSSSAWNLTTAGTPVNSFANWISNPVFGLAPADQDLGDDPDGDGINNGAENFFGTNPGNFSQGLLASTKSGNTFTFTHPRNATPASDLTASYQWSKDLANFLAGGATDGAGTTVTFTTQADTPSPGFTTVTATVTGTATSSLFFRVDVTQN